LKNLPRDLCSDVERHLAGLLHRLALAGGASEACADAVGLAAALAGLRSREGHSCVVLAEEGGRTLEASEPAAGEEPLVLPSAPDWTARLRAVPGLVGLDGTSTPLVLDRAGRLYLQRLHQAESDVAAGLLARTVEVPVSGGTGFDPSGALRRYFPEAAGDRVELDWQKVAAFAALRSRLTVVCGGPGTGKTHTVVFVLALLVEQASPSPLRIEVCAPTGKAAARLEESMARTRGRLPCSTEVREALPTAVRTLHRLLGASADGGRFRHDAANPVEADVVVVDEASMVDVALMSRLLGALRPETRLILVGDPDQLPSVDAGSVLSDLCRPERVSRFPSGFAGDWLRLTGSALPAETVTDAAGPFAGRIVGLRRNRRFSGDGGLESVARAVRDGDVAELAGRMASPSGSEDAVRLGGLPPVALLKQALRGPVLEGWRAVFEASDPTVAFRAMERFRVLCAVREGPYGVESLNRLAVEILREDGRIRGGEWFAGRQVMVTVNDPSLQVSNGDLGLVWSGPDGLEVLFQGGARRLSPARMPGHETAFAMTVHKSQGSEFDRVLMVLPAASPGAESAFWDGAGRLLTRELVYTGLTRAREGAEIWAAAGVLEHAVANRVCRASGLPEKFAQPSA
jgi:exodeoxyribonuclease V alpha subunit